MLSNKLNLVNKCSRKGELAVDSHYRSIVKALSWRVFGTLITGLVVWAITGKAGLGAVVGLVDTTVKLGVYYMHERAWNRINFGRPKPPDYEI